jgi:hypothetical protein
VSDRSASLLATRRGKLLLLLLCAVQFLDVVDSSIMNVALPSIRRDLGFSAQGLQWVLSGYLVTYGGLLLLGGRAGTCSGGGGCLWRAPRCSRHARWPTAWPWMRACWSAPGWRRGPARR